MLAPSSCRRVSLQTPLEYVLMASSPADDLGHRCAFQAEPTEAEYTNAVAEATQELQAVVTAIIEALEEHYGRYAEVDLRE